MADFHVAGPNAEADARGVQCRWRHCQNIKPHRRVRLAAWTRWMIITRNRNHSAVHTTSSIAFPAPAQPAAAPARLHPQMTRSSHPAPTARASSRPTNTETVKALLK